MRCVRWQLRQRDLNWLDKLGGCPKYQPQSLAGKTKKPTAKDDDGPISKKSRGDWTPLELFLAGVQRCEGYLRRCMADDKPKAV
jgi:hypothetical protein